MPCWLLCREPPPRNVLDKILNLILRFQQCWSFGECGVLLHSHHLQVHSGQEWFHLIGSYLWVK